MEGCFNTSFWEILQEQDESRLQMKRDEKLRKEFREGIHEVGMGLSDLLLGLYKLRENLHKFYEDRYAEVRVLHNVLYRLYMELYEKLHKNRYEVLGILHERLYERLHELYEDVCKLFKTLLRLYDRLRKEIREELENAALRFTINFKYLLLQLLYSLSRSIAVFSGFVTFPGRIRPPCTTMPWTIWPALAVLWGVCWMFFWPRDGSAHDGFEHYLSTTDRAVVGGESLSIGPWTTYASNESIPLTLDTLDSSDERTDNFGFPSWKWYQDTTEGFWHPDAWPDPLGDLLNERDDFRQLIRQSEEQKAEEQTSASSQNQIASTSEEHANLLGAGRQYSVPSDERQPRLPEQVESPIASLTNQNKAVHHHLSQRAMSLFGRDETSGPAPGNAEIASDDQERSAVQNENEVLASLGEAVNRETNTGEVATTTTTTTTHAWMCHESGCNQRQFSRKRDLYRHKSSCHSMHLLFCPQNGCKFARSGGRGISRLDNLRSHIERIHPGNSVDLLEQIDHAVVYKEADIEGSVSGNIEKGPSGAPNDDRTARKKRRASSPPPHESGNGACSAELDRLKRRVKEQDEKIKRLERLLVDALLKDGEGEK